MKRKLFGLLIVAFGIFAVAGFGMEAQADALESSSPDGSVYEKTEIAWNLKADDPNSLYPGGSTRPFYQISYASNFQEIAGNCMVDQCDKTLQVDVEIVQSTMTEVPDTPCDAFGSVLSAGRYIGFSAYGHSFFGFASPIKTVRQTHTINSQTYYYKHYFKETFTTHTSIHDLCKTEYFKRYRLSDLMIQWGMTEDSWYSMLKNSYGAPS